jgi:hypothetical protein
LLKKLFSVRTMKKRTAKRCLPRAFAQTHNKENRLTCAWQSMHGEGLPGGCGPKQPHPPLGQKRFVLAGAAPASNFEPVEMALCAGRWPARQHRAICVGGSLKRPPAQMSSALAGHLNDRQHKCHQLWRLLKQPASTNAITAGGFLGRPPTQNSSLLAVA